MKRYTLLILLLVLITLTACGGGGGSTAASGTVALFVTDNLEEFNQVTTTITGVKILHTGSGASCSILSDPVTLDIAELSSEFLLLDLTHCAAGQFNRIRVEMDRSVELTLNEITDEECTYTSYKDNENKPNVLQCSGDTCSMEINGMVNVTVNKSTSLVLDFDLKEFEVEAFGEPGCSVTMKVEPLNANDVDDKKNRGNKESVKGIISDLNSKNKTFTLTKKGNIFTVLYIGVNQEGIDDLLLFAQDNQLKTKVRCSAIDLTNRECEATEIYVHVEGTVSDLTAATFALTFNPEISVDYSGAEVEGTLADDAEVEVKLFEYNGKSYRALEVEVESQGKH
ncbi:DUF4382 domain-containing protein [bacterium]|nr:MAG: DUF4382 domain-containing protein [bacterium]